MDKIDVTRDETYLCARFDLFEKFTVPSVSHQTDQDFVWIVFFSENIPDQFKERIDRIRDDCPTCRPVYVKDSESSDQKIQEIIRAFPTDYCITTRLDNVDALAIDYMEAVHKYFELNLDDSCVLIYENGIQYDMCGGYYNPLPFSVKPLQYFYREVRCTGAHSTGI